MKPYWGKSTSVHGIWAAVHSSGFALLSSRREAAFDLWQWTTPTDSSRTRPDSCSSLSCPENMLALSKGACHFHTPSLEQGLGTSDEIQRISNTISCSFSLLLFPIYLNEFQHTSWRISLMRQHLDKESSTGKQMLTKTCIYICHLTWMPRLKTILFSLDSQSLYVCICTVA